MRELQLEIQSTLFLQEFEIAKDVLLNLLRLGFGINPLQIHNDLLDGVLTVAALDDFESRGVKAQGPLRHWAGPLLGVFSKTATWRYAPAIRYIMLDRYV